MNLKSKRILITGGTSGIGRELVDLLAEANELVVIGRDPVKLAELARRYVSVCPVRCDLSDPIAVEAVARRLAAGELSFDGLICNAAVQHDAWITEPAFDVASIPTEVATNLTSVCQLVAQLGPRLRHHPQERAFIALINSGLALAPKAGSAVYCATKAALRSLGQSIAYQLEDRNVLVTQAYLPLVDTPMTAGRGTGEIGARDAALAIIRGIEVERREHYIGKTKWLHVMHRLSPGCARRIMRRM